MAAKLSARRAVVVAIPVAVPVTMAALFTRLSGCLAARTAYNVGFGIYWGGWCLAVPLWLLGPRTATQLLTTGRPLSRGHTALLAMPVAGAIGTQLIPRRRELDPPTAVTMLGTAVINAVGEELLWRGLFMRELADRPRLAKLWSLIGFSAWHLAPQLILPSPLGRERFVAGSAVVGLTMTIATWRSGGLRQVVMAHVLTDACGVTAARFRLGRAFTGFRESGRVRRGADPSGGDPTARRVRVARLRPCGASATLCSHFVLGSKWRWA